MWTTSGLFLQRAKQSRYTIPERVRTHPTEASAVPPDTTLSPRPFPSGPTALGLRSFPPRPTRPPRLNRKIRLNRRIRRPGTSFAREIRLNRKIHLARKIRRPGTSFARKIYLNRKSAGPEHRSPGKSASPTHVPSVYRRPVLHSTRHPSCPPFSRSALLHRHVSHPFPLAATRAAHRPSRRMACLKSRAGAAPIQICRPDRMPRQKERQPAGAAALRQSDSGPIICC